MPPFRTCENGTGAPSAGRVSTTPTGDACPANACLARSTLPAVTFTPSGPSVIAPEGMPASSSHWRTAWVSPSTSSMPPSRIFICAGGGDCLSASASAPGCGCASTCWARAACSGPTHTLSSHIHTWSRACSHPFRGREIGVNRPSPGIAQLLLQLARIPLHAQRAFIGLVHCTGRHLHQASAVESGAEAPWGPGPYESGAVADARCMLVPTSAPVTTGASDESRWLPAKACALLSMDHVPDRVPRRQWQLLGGGSGHAIIHFPPALTQACGWMREARRSQ